MSRDFKHFSSDLKNTVKRLDDYFDRDAPRIAGIEAVNHFEKSFSDGGFTDSYLEKWKAAKRTDPGSTWYGFEAGAKTPTPDNHPKRWKTKKSYKARKQNAITNYSPAATKRKTLTGRSRDLSRSISYKTVVREAHVKSDSPYAKIHNEGGRIKVFGKATAIMPQRKFMGTSNKLNAKLKIEFKRDINKILRRHEGSF